ncbi:MAG: prepilin-type N-terminal cleavage/methylation domain-containing protein [Synergistaceae bacterium]|jgi:prepilin-type N-terminal cleavage/methylation domain-containing protein|nr:prepilin-type N-terminal cleavage/methylation domain-containing protein [Synergistaceae bacterium]
MRNAAVLGKKGFSLVELLLVIVLIAIIMALVTLSGGSMMASTSAQTEARRLIRTVQSLRSAWYACYADTQVMLGVNGATLTNNGTFAENLARDLSTYSDRSLTEEAARYGSISINVTTAGKISVGFLGPWNLGTRANAAINTMKTILNSQKGDYGITVGVGGNAESVFISVR